MRIQEEGGKRFRVFVMMQLFGPDSAFRAKWDEAGHEPLFQAFLHDPANRDLELNFNDSATMKAIVDAIMHPAQRFAAE